MSSVFWVKTATDFGTWLDRAVVSNEVIASSTSCISCHVVIATGIINNFGVFSPQRLEDQHLNGDPGAKSPTVPTKIRDIVTKSISPVDSKMASPGFGDESRMLQSEVSRLEDLLAATRAERDEIGSKYMAVSDKVRKACKM